MEFKLPELGENIEEAQVVDVLVSEGDEVDADQNLIAVETDKATLEVPSPSAGRISKLNVSKGDTLHVGDVVAVIEEAEQATGEEKEQEQDESQATEEPQAEQARDREQAAQGEKEADEKEPAAEEETAAGEEEEEKEKGAEEKEEKEEGAEEKGEGEEEGEEKEEARARRAPAEKAGKAEGKRKPDQRARKQEKKSGDQEKERDEPATPMSGGTPVFAAPSVRQLAREIGVELSQVQGSGPGGRITVDDVKRVARQRSRRDGQAGVPAPQPLPDFTQWGEIERLELSNVRRATATKMAAAWATAPHVTLFEKADATELEEAREDLKGRAEKQEVKLTITAMLVKIVAGAVHAHPVLATSIDMRKPQIIRKDYVHIGVAVDTPNGLMVPVIRDVNRKNLIELSRELADLAERARSAKLEFDDMQGGVVTVTNLGGLGTGFFTPIINVPQTAIVGVGRAVKEPAWNEESQSFEPRLMLPLSMSFDHRAMDGADAARALHWIVQAIEQPALVTLEG